MRFLITGDSWSQGEWDGYPDQYRVTHTGIQQYLIDDGHQVYNVGCGGFNNLESVAAIDLGLEFDHLIFFIQTHCDKQTNLTLNLRCHRKLFTVTTNK